MVNVSLVMSLQVVPPRPNGVNGQILGREHGGEWAIGQSPPKPKAFFSLLTSHNKFFVG